MHACMLAASILGELPFQMSMCVIFMSGNYHQAARSKEQGSPLLAHVICINGILAQFMACTGMNMRSRVGRVVSPCRAKISVRKG